MIQEDRIMNLLHSRGLKKKDLLTALGANWNGSINNILRADMRISRLESIANYFSVSTDYLLGRSESPAMVNVSGNWNTVHDINNPNRTITNDPAVLADQLLAKEKLIEAKDALIAEKDQTIALLRELLSYEKRQPQSNPESNSNPGPVLDPDNR